MLKENVSNLKAIFIVVTLLSSTVTLSGNLRWKERNVENGKRKIKREILCEFLMVRIKKLKESRESERKLR